MAQKPQFDVIAPVSNVVLGKHLGVHRNRIPDLASRFGLIRRGKGWRPIDVFRQMHRIEPMLLATRLADLKRMYSRPAPTAVAETDGDTSPGARTEASRVCYLDELDQIEDLATTLWTQGLVRLRDCASEFGYSYDAFRKKLKTGAIDLPPVPPIIFSTTQHVYRPLDVLLWTRHRIALELPGAAIVMPPKSATTGTASAPGIPADATPEAMTTAVFASAIVAEQGGAE